MTKYSLVGIIYGAIVILFSTTLCVAMLLETSYHSVEAPEECVFGDGTVFMIGFLRENLSGMKDNQYTPLGDCCCSRNNDLCYCYDNHELVKTEYMG